ncbi:MAG: hypothetical protein ACXWF8_06840 [Methylobacter sp.]
MKSQSNCAQISGQPTTKAQLLDQAQQSIESTRGELSPLCRALFRGSLNHETEVCDFFRQRLNDPDTTDAGLTQTIEIISCNLDHIRDRSIRIDAGAEFCVRITTDAFSPRVKKGEAVFFSATAEAEDDDLVIVPGDVIRVEMYSPGVEYIAASTVIQRKRSAQAQQTEILPYVSMSQPL